MLAAAALSPNPWAILPFGLLLALIAIAPLTFGVWWSRHYSAVVILLSTIVVVYYGLGLRAGPRIGHTAHEYFSFMCLIGSLFAVSGGIHISIRGGTGPFGNTLFLGLGALAANLLGTTGASMLLIRPWIRMNRVRITSHHIVFFIFIVSNVGGALTPIGDPPLFLGYLKGVPFWWVAEHCWPIWATAVGLLLGIFFILDSFNFRRLPPAVQARERLPDTWSFRGGLNLVFLGIILGAVFVPQPLFLRETLMIGAGIGSYVTTRKDIHAANDFSLEPIKEVAILFFGIFATMMPALDWLEANATKLGTPTPARFFWGSGVLSSLLDNAPTYLSFLSAEIGALVTPDEIAQGKILWPTVAATHPGTAAILADPSLTRILMAISMGAVFFGANTYIGNGPNFLVKAIADQQQCKTPTFLEYVYRYTIPFMLPMLALISWIFFM